MGNDYHVLPGDTGWTVKQEGAERASSLHETQKDAIEHARHLAQKQQVEVVIHRPDGQIRDSDSYGDDPNPPKDRKH